MPRSRSLSLATIVFLSGLALRMVLVWSAPRWGYPWDHFDVIGMGIVAADRGLLTIYSTRPQDLPVLRGIVFQDGRAVTIERRCVNMPNYPPLGEVVMWLQSAWLRATQSPLIVNTVATRLATSVLPIAAELITAVGVWLLVAALTSRPAVAAAAGAATWLAPPLMMNTALWSQFDALVLAPSVFAVLAMVRGRFARAGLYLALALLLKPQGLLLAPIACFGALLRRTGDRARDGRAVVRRLLAMSVTAAAAILVLSAPWIVADGFAWIRRCYFENFLDKFPYTTLEAFNVWYLRALMTERAPVFDVLASTTPVAGLSWDAWGRVLLAVALAATTVLCWRRYRHAPGLALVLFAGVWLWSVFMWPTRVHERYILYCVPFMIAAAAALPRLRAPVVVLLLVATMEHGWMIWRSGAPVGSFDRGTAERLHDESFRAYWRGRDVTLENAQAAPKVEDTIATYWQRYRADRRRSEGVEWLVTILSIGAYAWTVLVIAAGAPGGAVGAGLESEGRRVSSSGAEGRP